ncbi:helix-turn-helix domain-containing protein [Thermoflexibacter ruber]|uniref:Helix-turn-helix n=1 Tax=Thermoflexibacter ruber TaxID=1003 RepID=A0A1I2JGV0_9BACT|nr:helix-turn-helix domain-containing protein [Thermoflexibacter ruber]SFF53220.1 Helix-turn-helix [Thermoflexibacter ruber]
METLDIGLNIKKIRELKNFTQEYMAEKLQMSQRGYSKIENGEVDISFTRIRDIAKILGLKPADIIGFDERFVLFSITHNQTGVENGIYINNELTNKERELYEKQIALLESQNKELKEMIDFLKNLQNRNS